MMDVEKNTRFEIIINTQTNQQLKNESIGIAKWFKSVKIKPNTPKNTPEDNHAQNANQLCLIVIVNKFFLR